MSETGPGPASEQPVDVHELLAVMLEQLSAVAWQKMGLQPDFMTGKIEKDVAQAKSAIDAVTGLAQVLERQLDGEDKRRIQNLVRDLQINFVEHSR
ncbi:MAG: DUF1844 domain-containing protein [Armatimonadetes bacterium]|nr:DUF1844 domain-containing protein [Armatimonadota bacterium]